MTKEEKQEMLELMQEVVNTAIDPIKQDIKSLKDDVKKLDTKIDTQTAELKEYIKSNNVDIAETLTSALERTDHEIQLIKTTAERDKQTITAVRELVK